jgi:CDP-glucose 4,6-dehydratase
LARWFRAVENLAVSQIGEASPNRGVEHEAAGSPFPTLKFWKNRKVFVTGHTGFKGCWLSLWLTELGAEVTGYALAPATTPNMFDAIGLGTRMTSIIGDIRDRRKLEEAIEAARPDIVFHLAAQSLVRESYLNPLDTFEVNVQGTANLLNGCLGRSTIRSIAVVSSDKCYRNESGPRAFTEEDPLGGRDPYSASKACAEVVTAAYRHSFYAPDGAGPARAALASARAGNVIGGGDWAADRIVPDLVRALVVGRPAIVRNPEAVRPWQHVLDPIAGYLMLAQAGWRDSERYATSFNFGPDPANSATVRSVVEAIVGVWSGRLRWEHRPDARAPHEASALMLDSSKAQRLLGWRPSLGLAQAIKMTAAWYDAYLDRQDMAAFTGRQIEEYVARASTGVTSGMA